MEHGKLAMWMQCEKNGANWPSPTLLKKLPLNQVNMR